MNSGYFLAGIAAVIWDPENEKYLLLRRAESKDFGAGMWECVTGRVDQGESFTEALIREVREEIGAAAQIEFFIGTEHFYRGEPVPENELLSVTCCCTVAQPTAVRLSQEHSEYRWLTAVEIAAFLPPEHWLQGAIRRAELLRAHLPQNIRAHFRQYGLETSATSAAIQRPVQTRD